MIFSLFLQQKMAEIDWASINEKLPYERNDEQKAKRKELFTQFDPNGNGYLSLAEVRFFFFFLKKKVEKLIKKLPFFSRLTKE